MCFTHTLLPTSTFFFILTDLHSQSFSLAFSVAPNVQDGDVLRTHVASRHLFCVDKRTFRQLRVDFNPQRTGQKGAG